MDGTMQPDQAGIRTDLKTTGMECRHCYSRKQEYFSIWSVFFNVVNMPENIFDHVSCSKYWYVTEPYLEADRHELPEVVQSLRLADAGVNVEFQHPGFHNDSVVTMIFSVSDVAKFTEKINKELDMHTRYESSIRHGRYADVSFNKSGCRQMVKTYKTEEATDSFHSALRYLRWEDKK